MRICGRVSFGAGSRSAGWLATLVGQDLGITDGDFPSASTTPTSNNRRLGRTVAEWSRRGWMFCGRDSRRALATKNTDFLLKGVNPFFKLNDV